MHAHVCVCLSIIAWACHRWAGLERAERYRQRIASRAPTNPDDGSSWDPEKLDDPDNPLPGRLDPITLQVRAVARLLQAGQCCISAFDTAKALDQIVGHAVSGKQAERQEG